jgi:hypothetical protein
MACTPVGQRRSRRNSFTFTVEGGADSLLKNQRLCTPRWLSETLDNDVILQVDKGRFTLGDGKIPQDCSNLLIPAQK